MRVLILGATPKPERYAHKAAMQLAAHRHEVVLLGNALGEVPGIGAILVGQPPLNEIDTVTLYVNPDHQVGFEDYLLGLRPRRIIFNPGTENPTFAKKAKDAGILTEDACTLVMLATGQF